MYMPDDAFVKAAAVEFHGSAAFYRVGIGAPLR